MNAILDNIKKSAYLANAGLTEAVPGSPVALTSSEAFVRGEFSAKSHG